MLIRLFFILLLCAVIPVFANGEQPLELTLVSNPQFPNEQNSALTDDAIDGLDCHGYLRAGYIQTDHVSATALGAEIACGYQINSVIEAYLGVFSSWNPGVNSANDNNIQGEFFNNKQDSYLIVGEAFLAVSFEQFHARLGRQHLDSPHMDADDLRIIPNLFEAYSLDYHVSDQLSLGTAYVREAAGWENSANASQFVSIGEALGGKKNGAWLSWLSYQKDEVSSDSWFYYIPDHLAIFYSELLFNNAISDTLSYSIGLQFDWGRDLGKSKIGAVDAHTFGVISTIFWRDTTFTGAYNKNFGDSGAIASIGGGPFFTSVEDQTLDAVEGRNSEAILVSVEYHFNNYLDIGMMAGKFNASNKKDYNKEELNVFVNFNWGDSLTAELMYAVVNDLNSNPDLHQVRTIVTYYY